MIETQWAETAASAHWRGNHGAQGTRTGTTRKRI